MADRYYHEKKRMAYIVFAIIVVIFGVVLWRIWSRRQNPQEGEIRVEISSEQAVSKELEYNATKMVPGEKREYVLIVDAKDSGSYTLNFLLETDTASGTAFAKFVNVSIFIDGKSRGIMALQKGFEGQVITLTEWIAAGNPLEVTIVYEMSLGATDDVQGESIDFELLLHADATVKK